MPDAPLVRANIVVRGRVQMVGFRAFVVRAAGPVAGTVRNLADGGVQCVAEGRRADVEALIERIGQGPPAARVDSVDITWESPSGTYTDMRTS
jgi:acylphosphatase